MYSFNVAMYSENLTFVVLERGARQHMRKLLNEALHTRIASNLCEYWLQMNGTGFLVLDACSYRNFSSRKVS